MFDHIPPSSLLCHCIPTGAYRDCCQGKLPPSSLGLDEIVPAFFKATPGWFHVLLKLRNWLVAPLGLKTGPATADAIKPPFVPGQRLGIFCIYAVSENEIVLGEDDLHLDFRTSLLLLDTPQGRHLAACTWVSPHNLGGRVYLALVKPFHRLIVTVMVRNTLRRLTRERQP